MTVITLLLCWILTGLFGAAPAGRQDASGSASTFEYLLELGGARFTLQDGVIAIAAGSHRLRVRLDAATPLQPDPPRAHDPTN